MERTFLFTAVNARTSIVDHHFAVKGETLYQAILNELIANGGCFMWWDSETLGTDTSPEEKAVEVLTALEGVDCCDFAITVCDSTDLQNIYIILPKSERPKDFDPLIIGKKFYINCWIPAYDKTDRPSFDSMLEAEAEVEQLRLMQPENIYRIEGE